MRKVKRLLKENWIPIVAGILLTKWAVDYAYQMARRPFKDRITQKALPPIKAIFNEPYL